VNRTALYRRIMLAVAILSACGLVWLMVTDRGEPQPRKQSTASTGSEGQGAGMTDAEIAALENRIRGKPGDTEAMRLLANRLYDVRRFDQAVLWYRKVLDATPNDVDVSTDLGTALWYAGRTDDAIAQLEHSLTIDPLHSQTLHNLGVIRLHGKSDRQGAIAAWEKLVEAHPDDPQAVEMRQRILDLKGIQ